MVISGRVRVIYGIEENMRVTINQIAMMAGVSTGTVDRVLNNRGRVSKEVEERVRTIAKELNYKPNLMAKSLALKKNASKIGVVFHVKYNYFTNEVIEGIKKAGQELDDYGIKIQMEYCSTKNALEQIELIDKLVDAGVAALALIPLNDKKVSKKIDEVIAKGIPVYCMVNDIDTEREHGFIGNDAYEIGEIAGGLFSLIGHQGNKLAVVIPELKLLGHVQKVEGLKEALVRRNSGIVLKDVCEIDINDIDTYKFTLKYFKENPDVTLVWFAISVSEGGMIALEELGLLHKVKIICLDMQDYTRKGLEEGFVSLAIKQNPYEQGYATIKEIFEYLLVGNNEKNFRKVNSTIVISENI